MKKNNKGFTLAELLIVVAIIGVLIAIAMPTFNAQLENARKSADTANLRAAYGDAVADYLGAATPSSPVEKKITLTHTSSGNWVVNESELPFTVDSSVSTHAKGSNISVYFHFDNTKTGKDAVTVKASAT